MGAWWDVEFSFGAIGSSVIGALAHDADVLFGAIGVGTVCVPGPVVANFGGVGLEVNVVDFLLVLDGLGFGSSRRAVGMKKGCLM